MSSPHRDTFTEKTFLFMSNERMRKMSDIAANVSMDTVKESKMLNGNRAFDIVLEAQMHYNNMSRFRKERERIKRYVYGNQWGDIIYDPDDKKYKTEEQYIRDQGKEPLTNNLMRRLVRSVVGVYRSQQKEPTCVARDRDEQKLGEVMSAMLQYNMQLNRMDELNARSFEEFLVSGLIVHRKWYGYRNDKLECWTDLVPLDYLILDSHMSDPRGWDVSFIGQIHDIDFNTLASNFAKNAAEYKRLADIYSSAHARNRDYLNNYCEEFGYHKPFNVDFLIPSNPNMCRVIEVWRKESKPRYRVRDYLNGDVYKIEIEDYQTMVAEVNQRRLEQGIAQGLSQDEIPFIVADWFLDNYWYYYYLSPFGDILAEGETPYEHKSHPFVFKPYPLIDGEIHGFAGDFLDQQRYTNRLVTMFDWIMGSSAKGVLLFPEECLPKGMDLNDIADEWHRFNGVIAIKTKDNPSGVLPKQISTNSTNIGITELINLQLKFFEDISGVNGALQGKPGYSSTSGAKYAQEAANATTSLLDLLESFSSFKIDAAYKDVKNIQQFYDTKRRVNIAGRAGSYIEYDPNKIRDVEYDISISESTSTPAYRQRANEFLMTIWQSGQITLEQLLKFGSFEFADELLQSIESQKQDIENGQQPQQFSPQLMQKVQDSANMDNVNKAYDMLANNYKIQ